jgi:hypothetical protein
VSAEVQAAHPAGLVEMREGPLQSLPAEPQQPLAAGSANASTIAIHRGARRGILLSAPPSPIGLGDMAPDAHCFEIDE